LQRLYIRLRDEICQNGNVLRSPALLFTELQLEQELTREQSEKDAASNSNQNSISINKPSDEDEKKDAVSKFHPSRSTCIDKLNNEFRISLSHFENSSSLLPDRLPSVAIEPSEETAIAFLRTPV
jgi:hypothetical protein